MASKTKIVRKSPIESPYYFAWIFTGLCAILLISTLILVILAFPGSGWDFLVYISAVIAEVQHLNPYDPAIIGQISHLPNFPFLYPPHTLAFFYILFIPRFFYIYYLVWTLFLLLSFYVMTRWEMAERLYLFTLLTTGFLSVFWSYLTGNLGILYLFLFSLVFYGIYLKRYYISSIVMGILASINIFPIIFSAVYALVRKNWIERLAIILTSVAVLGIIFLGSFLAAPSLFNEYLNTVQSGTNNPFLEGGGKDVPVSYFINTPSPYWLIDQLLKPLGLMDTPVFIALSAIYAIFIGFLWYLFYKKNNAFEMEMIAFSVISIFLILPRLKPYYFTFVLIPIFILTKKYGISYKLATLSLVSLVPLILYLIYPVSQNIITSFGQFLALLIVFIFIFMTGMKDRAISTKKEKG